MKSMSAAELYNCLSMLTEEQQILVLKYIIELRRAHDNELVHVIRKYEEYKERLLKKGELLH